MQKRLVVLIWLFTVGLSSCSSSTITPVITTTPTVEKTPTPMPTKIVGISNYGYTIVQQLPHDTSAFTEGLTFKDGNLYESNGQNGLSDLRILDLNTGTVKNKVNLGNEYFGEGMTILNGKIFQLTWVNNKGFIYDANSLMTLGEFQYTGEGWGLTNDGRFLIMSNGSNAITYLNPETFQIQKVIYVYDKGTPVYSINELEYVKGEIYANIWHSNKVAQIDPELGEIIGWIDLTGLRSKEAEQNQEAVLNGIAYDSVGDRLFVTGKLWPTIFEIKLERK
jgi:glutamine cyclotransferase